MADIVSSFSAEIRERAGKGAARADRRLGHVPGVIYGNKEKPVMITLAPRDLKKELHKPGFFTRLFDVDINGEKHRVLPRDVQIHPLTDAPLHIDFMRVTADTTITVEVPVIFTNEALSPGIKRGGVLNIVRHEIELICKAMEIPHSLTVNLEGLEIGDGIHISDIQLPAGVRPTIADRDFTIATIAAPSVLKTAEEEKAEAEAAAVAAAAAEAAAVAAGGEKPEAGAEGKGEGKGKGD